MGSVSSFFRVLFNSSLLFCYHLLCPNQCPCFVKPRLLQSPSGCLDPYLPSVPCSPLQANHLSDTSIILTLSFFSGGGGGLFYFNFILIFYFIFFPKIFQKNVRENIVSKIVGKFHYPIPIQKSSWVSIAYKKYPNKAKLHDPSIEVFIPSDSIFPLQFVLKLSFCKILVELNHLLLPEQVLFVLLLSLAMWDFPLRNAFPYSTLPVIILSIL